MTMAGSGITLAILAGGEGSRMGRPKGELVVGGKPILGYLLERFNWPGPTLLVTAPGREHPPGWELFSREVSDPVTGEGPLRGVLTALEATETSLVIVTTVDMPEMGTEQFAFLASQIATREMAKGLMLHSPEDERKIEPFPSIYRREGSEILQAHMTTGQRSVHSLTSLERIISIAWPIEWPDRIWTNLNRPEELKAWLDR